MAVATYYKRSVSMQPFEPNLEHKNLPEFKAGESAWLKSNGGPAYAQIESTGNSARYLLECLVKKIDPQTAHVLVVSAHTYDGKHLISSGYGASLVGKEIEIAVHFLHKK